MQQLIYREVYGPELAWRIETMGTMSVSVANRWQMGWPKRVKELLKAGTYLFSLEQQVDREKDVLAEAGDMQHLARHEILKIHEVPEAPPVTE